MSIETNIALLLRQMIHLHGSKSGDWKGTDDWRKAAELVEEEAEKALAEFADKYLGEHA